MIRNVNIKKENLSMAMFKVGIIGCGGRGRSHAAGYAASSDVKIVACADPKRENAKALAETHNIPESDIYSDYNKMLEEVKPDIVSVCTWTGLHAKMIIDSVKAGVKAIHAEKPMAPTWGESKKIYKACADNDVMITFCHQRRFGAHFVKAKELANDGTIGDLYRVEGFCSNLFDWGTHWFDMFFFYNNDEPAEWVIGQLSYEKEHTVFGVPVETNGLSYIKWKNGLHGLLVTGMGGSNCSNRIIGTKGMIEVEVRNGPSCRFKNEDKAGWQVADLKGVVPPGGDTTLSVLDLIDCLKTGQEPVLSGRKALQATELIFATYESSRKRARINLPLEIEDSPLISMIEDGTLKAK
ncbi:gfo/Idh/MocA family oxidoreductase [Candidatus Poribacteria bacterium]|nr:gfo/Idh/MocA family oxidoreductase [Candidatus Poribacteria bacterium]